jgi:hypothetical protein
MNATVSNSSLNNIQLHLLKMFSFTKSEDGLKDLQSVLFNYYRNKLKEQTDEFWENNHLDSSKMEEIMYGHNRLTSK